MNANELANELEACFTKSDWNVLEAATMLRQQQEQIKEKDVCLKLLADEIEALKYEKSSGVYDPEPVAWMWNEDGCNLGVVLDQDKQIGKQEFQDYDIPLYTAEQLHPAKTLTDEEIMETVKEMFDKGHISSYDPIEFVRTILRKASKK
jgi:hypothetical protein